MLSCSDLISPEKQQFISLFTLNSVDEVPSHKREKDLPEHTQGGHHGKEGESLNKERGLERQIEMGKKEVKEKTELEKLATMKRKVDKVQQVLELPATKKTVNKKPADKKPATKVPKITLHKAPWR